MTNNNAGHLSAERDDRINPTSATMPIPVKTFIITYYARLLTFINFHYSPF